MDDLDKICHLIDDVDRLRNNLHSLEAIARAHQWIGVDKEIRADARRAMRALAGLKETTLYDMRNQLKAEHLSGSNRYRSYYKDDCDD